MPMPNRLLAGRLLGDFLVVDGRLFVRGMDGLYCYDLRPKESAK